MEIYELCKHITCIEAIVRWFVEASTELQGINEIWSLQASSNDIFDTFLVVRHIF